jgi:hypothetical protein
MTGNLIGEKFNQYVFEQINQRQILYGKGYQGEASKNLKPDDQILINNNNSFLKLASGINIFQPQPEVTKKELEGSGELVTEELLIQGPVQESSASDDFFSFTQNTTLGTVTDNDAVAANNAIVDNINEQIKENNKLQSEAAKKKLKRIGLSENDIKQLGQGNVLAKSAVLFSGLSSLSGNKLQQRTGISKSLSKWNPDSVYGLGGNKFGKQPMPGIVSAEVKCLNRGSIRSATVQIKAHNQFQFDLLELLYMRLGYTMLLEWGHMNFIGNNGKRQKVGTTLTETMFFKDEKRDQNEVLEKIQEQRINYQGNVDAFFGRVTNFSWKFSPDGTYDITLELYTLGDIVESLAINVPAAVPPALSSNKDKDISSKISNYTILEKWMDSYIASYGENEVTGNGKYINLFAANYNNGSYSYQLKNGWDKDNKYYCTFKELLLKIVEYCIPLVVGKTTYPMVNFDLDETYNIVSAQPNQISFDLETCFIKPHLYMPVSATGEGLNRLSTLEKPFYKKYFVLDKEDKKDLYYGQLMNCYLNFKFIKQQLKKNIGKDGKLTLYKFLVGICDGINNALGDVNKIQPIIKDGNKIVFIDQVQPKGNESIIKKLIPVVPKLKEYPFELYGFNQNKSNFVNSFSFESKIDAKLSTSLAIGATAGNSQTSLNDGTAFSSWNTGLQDRFSKEIIPPSNKIDTGSLEKAEEERTNEELKEIFNRDGFIDYNDWFGEPTRSGTIEETDYSFPRSTFEEFKTAYKQWLIQNPITQTKEAFLSQPKSNLYSTYLAIALGGKAPGITEQFTGKDAQYLNIENKEFFSQLKQSFKDYIQKRDEKIFRLTNTSSNRDGFIPLSLNLDIFGLSGIKIYQKLPVTTRFLPSQYTAGGTKNTIDFIIESVDHSISDNKWNTKISTLSIPPTAITNVNIIDNSLFAYLGVDPPPNFDTFVKTTPWSACFISYLALSTGVNFPLRSNHAQYSEAIRTGGYGWKTYDPREAASSTKAGNKRYIGKIFLNMSRVFVDANDTVYTGQKAPNSFKGVKVGDIIVKNREGNNLNYFSNPYEGYSHGDIVVEITENEIRCIGGNVSDTVKYSTYTKTTKTHNSNEDNSYTTNGAIKDTGEGNLVFVALRADNEADALKMVAKAKEEYELWKGKGWKDSDYASFDTLAKYYDTIPLLYPSPNETQSAVTESTT